jgi:hypothetical protein
MKRQDHCAIDGCTRPYYLGGFCSVHYNRKLRHGDPLGGRKHINGDVKQWLVDHVGYKSDECLIWPFARSRRDGRAIGKYELAEHGMMHDPCTYLLTATKGAKPSPGMQAAHSCGNGTGGCVNPSHLRWATARENIADKAIHGTQHRGEATWTAKLTAEVVTSIRRSDNTCAELAEQYGVSETTVWKARVGKSWAHVGEAK